MRNYPFDKRKKGKFSSQMKRYGIMESINFEFGGI